MARSRHLGRFDVRVKLGTRWQLDGRCQARPRVDPGSVGTDAWSACGNPSESSTACDQIPFRGRARGWAVSSNRPGEVKAGGRAEVSPAAVPTAGSIPGAQIASSDVRSSAGYAVSCKAATRLGWPLCGIRG